MAITPVFCCGFECGALGGAGLHWSSGTGMSISTTTFRTDGRSLRCNPSAASANSACPSVLAGAGINVFRFYLRFTTLPNGTTYIAYVTSGAAWGGLAFNSGDSSLYVATSAGTTPSTFGSTGVAVTTGQWYRIDLKLNTTTALVADAQVDGTAVAQLSSANAPGSSAFHLGAPASVSGDWFYDDFIISTTSADYPIGAGHVDAFVPTSDGTHTATTSDIVKGTIAVPVGANVAGATDVFNWVNAVPILGGATDNTRLLNQQTNDVGYAEVIFGPAPGVSTPTVAPRAVEVLTADRQASTTTGNWQTKINDNGTESAVANTGTVAGTTTDKYNRKHYATAPTGGAWTVVSGAGNFNNLRARFGYSSDANPDQYWRGIMIEAEFADSTFTPVYSARRKLLID